MKGLPVSPHLRFLFFFLCFYFYVLQQNVLLLLWHQSDRVQVKNVPVKKEKAFWKYQVKEDTWSDGLMDSYTFFSSFCSLTNLMKQTHLCSQVGKKMSKILTMTADPTTPITTTHITRKKSGSDSELKRLRRSLTSSTH